jgi:Zn finger protein HypA/HybF involved in hydrogenase expression
LDLTAASVYAASQPTLQVGTAEEMTVAWDRLNAERLDMCGKLTRAESALRAAEGEIAAIRRQITCEECGEPATALHSTEGDGAYWLCDSEDTDHMEKYCGCEKFRFAGTLAPLAPAPVEWDEQVFLRGDDHANETCLGGGKHISRHFGMTAYRCHPKAPAPVMSKSMQRRINTMEGREMDAPVTVAGVPSRAILERGVVEAAQQWGAADLRENVASYDATMRLLGALERLRDLDASADSAVKP